MFLNRKRYLINPRFQMSFLVFSSIVSILGMSVFFLSIKYFFWSFHQLGEKYGIPADHIFFKFIDDQSAKMNVLFLLTAIIVLIISLVGAVMLSHRVAGPIYRMTQHFNSIKSKADMKEVKFRKGDFFIELQNAFNHFIKKTNQ